MIGKPYERVAESGTPTTAQKNAARRVSLKSHQVSESTLLADGRLRVTIENMSGPQSGLIAAQYYFTPDGSAINH